MLKNIGLEERKFWKRERGEKLRVYFDQRILRIFEVNGQRTTDYGPIRMVVYCLLIPLCGLFLLRTSAIQVNLIALGLASVVYSLLTFIYQQITRIFEVNGLRSTDYGPIRMVVYCLLSIVC